MNKSLKGLKQESLNERQFFEVMKDFVDKNQDSPVVQNAIHQVKVEIKKGIISSGQSVVKI